MSAQSDIFDRLKLAPAFHPGAVELFDDITLEPGDIVKILSGSDEKLLPIYNQVISWTGSAMVSLESTGNEQRSAIPPLQKKQAQTSFSSGRSAYGQSKLEKDVSQFHTEFTKTDTEMCLVAEAIGVKLDADGKPVVDKDGKLVYDETSAAKIFSNLKLTHNQAALISAINDKNGNKISGARVDVSAEGVAIIEAINNQRTGTVKIYGNAIKMSTDTGSCIEVDTNGNVKVTAVKVMDKINADKTKGKYIDAAKIYLNGEVIANSISAVDAKFEKLVSGESYSGNISVTGTITGTTVTGTTVRATTFAIVNGENEEDTNLTQKVFQIIGSSAVENFTCMGFGTTGTLDLRHYHKIVATEGTGNNAGKIILTLTDTVATSDTTDHVTNFSIAATQTYKDGIAAATPTAIDCTAISTAYGTVKVNPTLFAKNAAGTNLISQQVVLEKTTYNIDADTTNHCVNLKIGTKIIGRISTESVYEEGYSAGGGGVVNVNVDKGSWTNGKINFTPSEGTGDGASVSLKVTPSVDWSSANVPANPTFRIYDGSISTQLSGTFYLQVTDDYVYVKSDSATSSPTYGTNVMARRTNTAYSHGQQSVNVSSATLSNITANASARTASASLTITLDNGKTPKTIDNVDVSSIYQAGLDGGSAITTKNFSIKLADNNGSGTVVKTVTQSVDVSDVYQKGKDDAKPPVTGTKYVYASNGGTVYMRKTASSSGSVIGSLYPRTPVEVTGESGSFYAVTYGSYSGYMSKTYVKDSQTSPTKYGSDTGWKTGWYFKETHVSGVYYTGSGSSSVVDFALVWVYYTNGTGIHDEFVLAGSWEDCDYKYTQYDSTRDTIRSVECEDERLDGKTVYVVFDNGYQMAMRCVKQ